VRDYAVLAALLLSFATLLTTHVAIALRLVLRARPRYRGVVALLVPPLAPWWAYEQGWRRMVVVWIVAVAVYLVIRVLAAF
jgi:hypothetical protein